MIEVRNEDELRRALLTCGPGDTIKAACEFVVSGGCLATSKQGIYADLTGVKFEGPVEFN